MNTKKIGEIGVLAVATKLAANGITSSFPIGDSTRYDLILELNGEPPKNQQRNGLHWAAEYEHDLRNIEWIK